MNALREIPAELLELLPDGLPRVSCYDEFRRITGEADTPEVFIAWLQVAYTLMSRTHQ